jgi:SecD/SecF fusion protein
MTDRRRHLIILTLVLALLGGAIAVVATKPTRLGLDLQGGVSLIYQAKPTRDAELQQQQSQQGTSTTANQPIDTGQAIERAIDVMRERVDQLGVSEPEIQRSGENQIDVSLPDVENAEEAAAAVGTTAQLFFYDWEARVLGPGGRPAPTDASVTGGQNAGSADSALDRYGAVVRASKVPERDYGTQDSTFYLVDDDAKRVIAGPEDSEREVRAAAAEVRGFKPDDDKQSIREIKPGTILVRAEKVDVDAPKSDRWYVLDDRPALGGDDIRNPEQNFDNGPGESGAPNVTFDFSDDGRAAWEKVTRGIAERGQSQYFGGPRESSFQHFAIVLDDELISVPQISWVEFPDGLDGRGGSRISGGFTLDSAQNLSALLQTGALPVELELISSSQVSATLGQQALDQGIVAGAAGFIIVALFLLIVYRVLGLIAVGALAIYAMFLFALVKLIPITLTLPGIAGLILTIGVAADANIVIFERVKEEIRAGRSVRQGIQQGYKKGLSAIIDANVVTLMVAFILFVLSTAGVRGFAFVLGVGTIVSFTTAVILTQAVLGIAGGSRLLSSGGNRIAAGKRRFSMHWDFMGASRWFFSASGVILVIGALAIGGKGLNFGIDFESGTRIKTELRQSATEAQVRDALAPVGLEDAEIQRLSGEEIASGRGFQISTETLTTGERDAVQRVLSERFGVAEQPSFETIGPTFGRTVATGAALAIIVSLLVISAYMALRFEWKYAVPVLIALMHDLLITAGVYSLTGREMTTSTVAALLTILGFSLYDTIIVFDRVRENVPRMPRAAFSQIVNRSMSEVIVRSLATSFCTILPVITLYFFGGETLKDFAFALIVGTASGTYSSIFIAGPVLTHWKEREPLYRRRRDLIAAANGGTVPAYATATQGPIDVEPAKRRTPDRRLTEPDLPGRQVSQAEFDEMVRDLEPTQTAVAERSRGDDALPEDVVMKDSKAKRDKSKRGPRNRKHGRH